MTITKNVTRIAAPEINASLRTITWKIPTVDQPLTLHIERMSDDTRAYAVIHGCKARVQDGAALSAGSTWSEKHDAMREIIEHLESGSREWNLRGGARGVSGDNALLVAALMELKPDQERVALAAWVRAKSPVERQALMASGKVKPIIDQLKAAMVDASQVDTDALMEELNELTE